MLKHAVEYAEAGFPVIPLWWIQDEICQCRNGRKCESPGKHPVHQLTPNGLKNATTDADKIKLWWRQFPQANIGLATGGHWFVIDCDKKNGNDGTREFIKLAREHGSLDDIQTTSVDTGGGGAHFWFAKDDFVKINNSQSVILCGEKRSGLDVRGEGGYVVAPPSNHISGTVYRMGRGIEYLKSCPAWLLNELAKIKTVSEPDTPVMMTRPVVDDAEIARIKSAVDAVPPDCDRETWLMRVGMPLHDHFAGSDDGYKIWLEWSRKASGRNTPNGNTAFVDDNHCRKQWQSLKKNHRNPKGVLTLFQAAISYGWTDTITSHAAVEEKEAINYITSHDIADPGPFPVDVVRQMDGPILDTIEWILQASRRPDPAIALAAGITIVSAAIGRRIIGPQQSRPSSIIALLAPSGAGKDLPQVCLKNALERVSGLSVGVCDETPYHRSQLDEQIVKNDGQICLTLDEYGSALRQWCSPGSTLSPVIRRLAGHGDTRFNLCHLSPRHPYRNLYPQWDHGIICPSMVLTGWSTPEPFYGALSAESLTDGFLGRHIVIVSDQQYRLREPQASAMDIPPSLVSWLGHVESIPIPKTVRTIPDPMVQAIGGAIVVSPETDRPDKPFALNFDSKSTGDRWSDICAELDEAGNHAFKSDNRVKGSVLRRLPGLTLPLATIIACGRADKPQRASVALPDVETALQITRWSADHLAWRLRYGSTSDDWDATYVQVCNRIEQAKGDKVYRASFRTAKAKRWMSQVWPMVCEDPRFETTAKWARKNQ